MNNGSGAVRAILSLTDMAGKNKANLPLYSLLKDVRVDYTSFYGKFSLTWSKECVKTTNILGQCNAFVGRA